MTANETASTSVRETIPPHLLSRIENEWQQMRAVRRAESKPEDRVAPAVQPASDA